MTPVPESAVAPVGDAAEHHGQNVAPPGLTRAERVRSAARGWQHRLSAVGGTNTLLWYRDLPTGTLELSTAHPGGLSMLMAGRPTRLSDLVRERSAFEQARLRAVAIRDTANELAQQRGLVSSFLGIGLATWTLRSGSLIPAAPVLLRAVTLRPTDGRLEDFMLDLAPAVELNPVLVHYLRSERGIEFEPDAVAALAHVSRRFDPSPVFRELLQLGRGMPGFRIEDRRILSTFPYAKLSMVADLARHGDALADHPVVAALAGDPGAAAQLRDRPGRRLSPATTRPPGAPTPGALAPAAMSARSDDLDPADELLVLDADAGQQDVVEMLRAGRSVVVDAPPGTGVTQTVANAAAAAAADGRSVLVVAQDEAELEDLAARLAGVGLEELVLRVREGAHHRRHQLEAVLTTLDLPAPTPRGDLTQLRADLLARRTVLARHLDGLTRPQAPWGVSVFEVETALAQLATLPSPPSSRVRLDPAVVSRMDRAAARDLARTIAELARAGAWEHGTRARTDPWWSARIATEQDAARARELAQGLSGTRLETDRRDLDAAFQAVGLPAATTPADYGRDLALVERVRHVRRRYRDEVFRRPLEDLLVATGDRAYRQAQPTRLGWWARRRLRQEARQLVLDGIRVEDLHGDLLAVRTLRADWTDRAGVGAVPAVPERFERLGELWARLEGDLTWLARVLAPTGTPGPFLEVTFPDLRQQMARLAARADRVDVIPLVLPRIDELSGDGLGELVGEFAARGVPPEQCEAEVELIWWASVLDQLATREPAYGGHDGRALGAAMAAYDRLDQAHIRSGPDQVMTARHERRCAAVAAHPEQLAYLRSSRDARRSVSAQELLSNAPDVTLSARPVWLMSPFVVASLVPPRVCFDVVIVLDAGRLEVPEALGAVLRGRAVAAFGDPRRLGPAPFAVVADGGPPDGPRPADDTSLSLVSALSQIVPTLSLRWQHRCADERLVSFANRRWYDGSLTTVPGSARRPPVEALDAPVDEFLERVLQVIRAQPVRRPGESFGVVAADRAAAERIRLALRRSLAAEPDGVPVEVFEGIEAAEPDRAMLFTIRDPWGFQGITRDRVLVVLGPTGSDREVPDTMPSQAALAVALTAARTGLTLMVPSEYRERLPSRWDSPAAAVVRDFVDSVAPSYAAASAAAAVSSPPEADHANPVEADEGPPPEDALLTELSQRLVHEGLTVHQGHGDGAHQLDIAVEDPHRPGAMLVAVDSDGRRARMLRSVRERDRLWPQHLRRAGWEHVRVWSTDVFRDPARDVARVGEAVRAAQTRTTWSGRA